MIHGLRGGGDRFRQCVRRVMGGQKGQRLPSIIELASLVDPNNTGGNPDLPPGHPFIGVHSSYYWSATTRADIPTVAWLVHFGDGDVFDTLKADNDFVWCVRGGHNDGSQY